MANLEALKQQRANLRRNITRVRSAVDPQLAVSSAELGCRLAILEAYFKQVMTVQTDIELSNLEDNTQRQVRSDIEEAYIATKVCIKNQMGPDEHNQTAFASESLLAGSHSTSLKLPRLSLPTFDGKYSDYQNFITSFKQVIDCQHNLSAIEKFNHLISCLREAALETVKAFQITAENYTKALERLSERYDKPSLMFLENISALFNLPTVANPNGRQLRSLIDNASALYNSLLSMGSEAQIAQAMLISIVMEKVDQDTKKKWNESLELTTLPTWTSCVHVIERHCEYLEAVNKPCDNVSAHHKPAGKSRDQRSHREELTFNYSPQSCQVCSREEHKIFKCPQFTGTPINQRWDTVKRLGLCLNCLGRGHQVAKCPSTQRCRTCARTHHTLLHRDFASTASQPSVTGEQPSEAVAHTHLDTCLDQVILATALVLVKDASGCYKIGRALLDSCSQVNFISEEFAQALRIPRIKRRLEIRSIGESQAQIKHRASTTIKSRFAEFELALDFCVTSHSAHHPDSEINIASWDIPQNTPLADDKFNKSRRVDLLLGTETFFDILSVGQVRLGPHLPVLQKTLLGWIVSGRCQTNLETSHSYALTLDETIDRNLERLWRIEDVSQPADDFTPEQRNCEDVFIDTIRQEDDGRIVVRLPFKNDPGLLGRSYDTARRRFEALERRLSRTLDIKRRYAEFMLEFERLGHMSLVAAIQPNKPHFYIPHHCVFKPNSTSTKLRVVFDASRQTTSQKSLNDLLMVGPTIPPDLFTLLLRFRTFQYAITADIVKMFRQVLIDPQDRKYQYILWRNTPDKALRSYELNTVTYGTASAPYLAIRSLLYLADHNLNKFKISAEAIKTSFYVDDFISGSDTISGISQLKSEVTEILKSGRFELAKWHSNHIELVDDNTVKDLNLEDDAITSTLGLKWEQRSDTLMFSFTPTLTTDVATKRSILSIASSLFDPLGLVSPIIIVAKIILQELWLLKLQWDESVPHKLHTAWTSFLSSMSSLKSLSVLRFCLQANSQNLQQLHGFCDASIRAYGACIYARTVDPDGRVDLQLITLKSRVAPTRKRSLPKLELCGAHLLSQLYAKIKESFAHKQPTTFLWSDSQIVLHWIQQHSATLSTFVGNRISEIQENTSSCHWKHVSTHCNPADLLSRGCTVAELQNSIWFNGPVYLLQEQDKWPAKNYADLDMEAVNLEKRRSAFVVSTDNNQLLHCTKSALTLTACVLLPGVFGNITRKLASFDTPSPSPQELMRALHCIIWNLQTQYFSEDIKALRKGQDICSNLKFLNPFLQVTDGFTLLKVGGRLELADMSDAQKHPILLPAKDVIVYRYVQYIHRENYHAGPKALVALIRLRFWIINARNLARRDVRSCVHCVRYRPTLL